MSSPKDGGFPRLGSDDAPKKVAFKTRVVEIPDRGVSVVLQKPPLGRILELQEKLETMAKRAKEAGQELDDFDTSVAVVAEILSEPRLSEEELAAEVRSWSLEDWQLMQAEAVALSGMGPGEEVRAEETREEFQEP